jgi:hypothetical protein
MDALVSMLEMKKKHASSFETDPDDNALIRKRLYS